MTTPNTKGNRAWLGLALRAPVTLVAIAVLTSIAGCSGGKSSPRPAPWQTSAPGDTPTETATATRAATSTPSPRPNEALAAAGRALKDGNFEVAAAGYGVIAAGSFDSSVRAEAALGSAVAKFQAGDRDGSVAMLRSALQAAPAGTAVAERAAYLLGVRLYEAKDWQGAAKALAPFAASPGSEALAPYLLFEYARALQGSSSPEAAATWQRLDALASAPASLLGESYRARADAAQAAGDRAGTATWLARLVASSGAAADRLALANAARDGGDTDTFATQLRAIIANTPGAKEAPLAIAELRDAGYAIDAGQEGLVYYRRGAYADARRVLGPAVEEAGISPETRAFRLFYLAAANEDAGNAADAVAYYDAAASTGASSPYIHRAKYWAARVVEGTGEIAAASARYADLAANGPAGEFTAEARFRAGYMLYEGGDAKGALAVWNRFDTNGDPRTLYWKGRAAKALGDGESATAAFSSAVAAAPNDFYAIQAARELGHAGGVDVSYRQRNLSLGVDWSAIAAWLSTRVPGAAPGSAPTAAADLAAVGLREEAADVIREAAGGAATWRVYELAREARDAGLVDVAAQLAVRLAGAAGVPLWQAPKDLLRVAYPVDYVVQLDEQAKANGLDPLFFAAVVRQESYWDAAAGSHAGALGLTQVIPPTGEGIAKALGVEGFKADDLFRPAVSLRFGAYYLGGQLKRYGDPHLALAAYNAGPGNASRWSEHADGSSPADLAEAIDIDETKGYVELIMQHYAYYQAAYGN